MSDLMTDGGFMPAENGSCEPVENEQTAGMTAQPSTSEAPNRKKRGWLAVLIVLLALIAAVAVLLLTSVRARIVGLGALQLGKPYIFGDTGPDSFDCSGLTSYVFANAAEIELGRTASMQGYDNHYEKLKKPDELKLCDLVFFNTVSDGDRCDHVGIYLLDGYFLHASSKREKVIVSSLSEDYYARVFSWGRRILPS